jgi:hypothetical protein
MQHVLCIFSIIVVAVVKYFVESVHQRAQWLQSLVLNVKWGFAIHASTNSTLAKQGDFIY